MPIPGREKHKLYKMLSFEKKAAERRLRATIKGWRTLGVDTHPGSWKEFLAARAGHGDQRAIRRLARKSGGLVDQERRQAGSRPPVSRRAHESGEHRPQPAERGTAPRVGRIDRAPRRGPRGCARAAGEGRQAEVRNERSHAPGIEARTRATGGTGCRTRVGNRRRAPALTVPVTGLNSGDSASLPSRNADPIFRCSAPLRATRGFVRSGRSDMGYKGSLGKRPKK